MVEALGAVAALVCILVGSLAARETLRTLRLRREGTSTAGTIVALESYRKGRSTLYLPVFEFQTPDGKLHRVTCQQGSSPSPYREGDSITVLYRLDSPAEAKIDAFAMLWAAPMMLWILTAGCLIAIAGGFYLAGTG